MYTLMDHQSAALRSSLDVLSKACQFVATQDQQTDVTKEHPQPEAPRQTEHHTKDPSINKANEKSKKGELKRPENNAHERTKDQVTFPKHSDKQVVSNGKERSSSAEERSLPPPPYTQTVETFKRSKPVSSSHEYFSKDTKGEESLLLQKRSSEASGRELLPPYTYAPSSVANKHIKEEAEKMQQHPYLQYAEMLAQHERRQQEIPHEALEQANAAALAMRAPIPQLPENFQRLMYPGINPLAFVPREMAIPSSYSALQPEQTPFLQAQLSSYAANLDQSKRFYESLQALQPQASAQYLNSLMLPTLQDPKAAASLYQRAANPGIVFPVPGYFLPGGFPYGAEMASAAGAKLTDMAGFMPPPGLMRNDSPKNLADSRMNPSPLRQLPTVKREEPDKHTRSPFQPFAGHRSHPEHSRPRPESSPKPKHRVIDERSSALDGRPTQVNELRYGHSDHSKADNTRRYDLSNPDHRGNGFNKFPSTPKHTKTRKVESPASLHIAAAKSPNLEHLKEKSRQSMSPAIERKPVERTDAGASPNYPNNKFPTLADNGVTSAHIQAFQAQQALLAQQLALGQMGAVGGIPPELLAGNFSQLSQLVPRASLSPNIRQQHTTVQQPQLERYSLKDSSSSQSNGASESCRSPAPTKAIKNRHSSPNSEGERYGVLDPKSAYLHPSPHLPKSGRRSASPRHFSSSRRENGVDGKRRSDTFDERSKPPGYPIDFRVATSHDAPNNKKQKTDVAAPSIEEHFRRSLGKDYPNADADKKLNITGTVDDHFSKSLGDIWKNYQPRPQSASPNAIKRRTDYPPPFIKSSLTEGRRPYANGNNPPPAYGEQNAVEAKHKHPVVEANKPT